MVAMRSAEHATTMPVSVRSRTHRSTKTEPSHELEVLCELQVK